MNMEKKHPVTFPAFNIRKLGRFYRPFAYDIVKLQFLKQYFHTVIRMSLIIDTNDIKKNN